MGASPLVSVLLVTWNSAQYVERCLASLARQDYPTLELVVVDNASTDGTPELLLSGSSQCRILLNDANLGFAAAQNQAIRTAHGEWLLTLNPDVELAPDFISRLMRAAERCPDVGVLCGKLPRMQPDGTRTRTLDSTGIYFTRNLRHLDRGSDEEDRGQYDQPEYVFGATAAAALYRRAMTDDVSVNGEFFDEWFFSYREDADVAWRAQLMGWRCLYVPDAVGYHVRQVTPETVRRASPAVQYHSVKNRFAQRIKNISPGLYVRLFVPIALRDLLILGYALLLDQTLLRALAALWRNRKQLWRKRRAIQKRRRVTDRELLKWFSDEPVSFPAAPEQPAAVSVPAQVIQASR